MSRIIPLFLPLFLRLFLSGAAEYNATWSGAYGSALLCVAGINIVH